MTSPEPTSNTPQPDAANGAARFERVSPGVVDAPAVNAAQHFRNPAWVQGVRHGSMLAAPVLGDLTPYATCPDLTCTHHDECGVAAVDRLALLAHRPVQRSRPRNLGNRNLMTGPTAQRQPNHVSNLVHTVHGPAVTIAAHCGEVWAVRISHFADDHTVALHLEPIGIANKGEGSGLVELAGTMTADGIRVARSQSTVRRARTAARTANALLDRDTVSQLLDVHRDDLAHRAGNDSSKGAQASRHLSLVRAAHDLPQRSHRALAHATITAGFTGTSTQLVAAISAAFEPADEQRRP